MTSNRGGRGRSRNHVFVFRHCVRSTSPTVDLYDGNGERNISDFAQLPDWNVPTDWCTESGMATMADTGALLLAKTFLSSQRQVRVRIISDTVQRDVDTAFAIAQGMANATSSRSTVKGLHSIVYDSSFFKPLLKNDSGTKEQGGFCDTFFSQDRLRRDIETRLHSLPPPPKLSLPDALQLLADVGAANVVGNLMTSGDNTSTANNMNLSLTVDSKNRTRIRGPVNLVKLCAQTMFYSRASGIHPPFLPKASTEQVYQLLPWLHWTRSVLNINNVQSANEGSVLARTVLDALQSLGEQQNDDEDHVTILVGHDTNMDTLATAFGITWELAAPYNDVYSPTLPGSALYFTHLDGIVNMSYLYPVFNLSGPSNFSFTELYQVPLTLDPASYTNTTDIDVNQNTSAIELERLQSRLFAILEGNPGAKQCWEQAAAHSFLGDHFPIQADASVKCRAALSALGSMCLALTLVLIFCCWGLQTRQKKYNAVGPRNVEIV